MVKFVDAKKTINNELSLLEKIPDKQLLPEDFDTIKCIKKINVEISSVRIQDLKSFDNIIRELYEEVDQVENSTKISSIRSNFLEIITHDSSLLTCISLVCIWSFFWYGTYKRLLSATVTLPYSFPLILRYNLPNWISYKIAKAFTKMNSVKSRIRILFKNLDSINSVIDMYEKFYKRP